MQTLLQRLESLTAPSREVSDELLLSWGWEVDTEDHEGIIWKLPDGQLIAGEPHPTAFIDDALLGVPEGWEWNVSNRAPEPHAGRAYIHNRELIYAGISGMTKNPKRLSYEDTAATPAIALCIAIVKARGGVR